jgi:hypothetical protein
MISFPLENTHAYNLSWDLPLRLPGECLFTKKHEVGSTRYNNARRIENNLGSPTMILRLVPSLLGSGIVGFVVNGQVEGL